MANNGEVGDDESVEWNCNMEELIFECIQMARHFTFDATEWSTNQWAVGLCVCEAWLSQWGVNGRMLPKNASIRLNKERLRAVAPAPADGVDELTFWRQFIPDSDGKIKFLSDTRREYAVLALEAIREFPRLSLSDFKFRDEPMIRPWGYYLHNLPRCMCGKERFDSGAIEAIFQSCEGAFSETFRGFFLERLRRQPG